MTVYIAGNKSSSDMSTITPSPPPTDPRTAADVDLILVCAGME